MTTNNDDNDFSDYIPEAFDPGLMFSVYVIIFCVLINLTLPLWLFVASRLDERKRIRLNIASNERNPVADGDHPERNDEFMFVSTESASSDGDGSYDGTRSNVSTIGSHLAAAILDARPRKTNAARRIDQKKRRRRERDVRMVAELARITTEEEVCALDTVGDESKSVLSALHPDAVSVHDAPDFTDLGLSLRNEGALPSMPAKKGLCDKILDVADWDLDSKRLCSLASWYTAQGLAETLFQIVDLAVIGYLVGVKQANAYITVRILFEFTGTLVAGFEGAIGTLVPQADGTGHDLMVGRYLQLGILFHTLFQIPGAVIWSFLAEDAILWFGFDEETAAIGQKYAYTVIIYLAVEGVNNCMLTFLDLIDRERYSTIFSFVVGAVSTFVVIVLAAIGVKDMVVIGLAQSLTACLLVLINCRIMVKRGWLDDYWTGLVQTAGFRDRQAVRLVFATAIPLGISWLLSYGEWELMTIFAREMGPAEVAAWGMVGYVWEAFEMIVTGIADASEVRVGFRMGAGKPELAKFMAEKGIYVGLVVSIIAAGCLLTVAEFLPQWITPDQTLQRMIFEVLPLISFGEILMAAGMVCWSVICAQGRARLATIIEFFVSWLVAIPLGAFFVYFFGYNLQGLAAALVLGYTVGANVYLFVLLRSDWEKLSTIVIDRNAAEGTQYLDSNWDQLPANIQEAAGALGYTREMWETNQEPESNSKSWDELNQTEQRAAGLLGYNRKKWNGGDSTDQASQQYDDYDFDELPSDALRAALTLGYTRASWNEGLPVPAEGKDWDELDAQEKEAACILGYDQRKWDGSSIASSSCSSSSSSANGDNCYDDYDFNELPSEVKLAALDLGYTESIWDDGGSVPAEEKDWDELSMREQAAARVLGYTKDKWDVAPSESRGVPQAMGEASLIQAVSDSNYDDYDFEELPPQAKQAALDLGYTKEIWDTNGDIPADAKDWDELNQQEQAAAHMLGYTREMWEEHSMTELAALQAPALVEPPRSREAGIYDDCEFMELPPSFRQAAIHLGYTRYLWDNDLPVESDTKRWNELSLQQQEAAIVFGYNEYDWDGVWNQSNDSSHSDETESVPQNYYDYYFHQLPPDAVDAAVYLGYSPTTWDDDGRIAAGEKAWDELSAGEQAAARILGYSEDTWDESSDEDSSSLSSNPSLFRAHIDDDGREFIPFQISNAPSFDVEPDIKYYTWNWDDLPIPVQAAAVFLGYTKRAWDMDEEIPADDKTWDELSPYLRLAASRLGYVEATWNEDDSSSSYSSSSSS